MRFASTGYRGERPLTGLTWDNPESANMATGQIRSTLLQQPASFANVFGNNFGGASQALASNYGNAANALGGTYGAFAGGLASTGKNFADAFGAYGAGLGTLATARANERSNMYGANAMAEAARMGAIGNLGASALGAFGGASNSALAAWAANQQAYNRSAADMHSANQQGMSNLGVSRNNALGSLGGAYGDIGKAQVAANALSNMTSNMNFSMTGPGGGSGGGFLATGPDGRPIVIGGRGSSGPVGGGGGGNFTLTGSANRTANSSATPGSNTGPGGALSGLGGLQQSLMDNTYADRIDAASQAGRDQLDSQHYSSRGMPSAMLNQTLGGLMALGRPAYDNINSGMRDFYSNNRFNERPYQDMVGAISSGFDRTGRQIGGVQRGLTDGYRGTSGDIIGAYRDANSQLGGMYNTANANVNNLWDRSLGQSEEFMSPAQMEIRARQAEIERRRTVDMQRAANDMGFGTDASPDPWAQLRAAKFQDPQTRRALEARGLRGGPYFPQHPLFSYGA